MDKIIQFLKQMSTSARNLKFKNGDIKVKVYIDKSSKSPRVGGANKTFDAEQTRLNASLD